MRQLIYKLTSLAASKIFAKFKLYLSYMKG